MGAPGTVPYYLVPAWPIMAVIASDLLSLRKVLCSNVFATESACLESARQHGASEIRPVTGFALALVSFVKAFVSVHPPVVWGIMHPMGAI